MRIASQGIFTRDKGCEMSKNTYTAENGFVITDDVVDKWADEAEDNFSGATITKFAGRAWEDETQPLKPRTVRLSDTV